LRVQAAVKYPRVRIDANPDFPLPSVLRKHAYTTAVWVKPHAVWNEQTIVDATRTFVETVRAGRSDRRVLAAWLSMIRGSLPGFPDEDPAKWDVSRLTVGRKTLEWDVFTFRAHGFVVNGLIPFDFRDCIRATEEGVSIPRGPKWVLEGIWVSTPLARQTKRLGYREWLAERVSEFQRKYGRSPRPSELSRLQSEYRNTPKKFSTHFFFPTHVKGEDLSELGLASRMESTLRVLTVYVREVGNKLAEYPAIKQWAEEGPKVMNELEEVIRAQQSDIAEKGIENTSLKTRLVSRDIPVLRGQPMPTYIPMRSEPEHAARQPAGVSLMLQQFPLSTILTLVLFLIGVVVALNGLFLPLPNASADVVAQIASQKNGQIFGGVLLVVVSLGLSYFTRRRPRVEPRSVAQQPAVHQPATVGGVAPQPREPQQQEMG
jgi:hypothetical protein